MDAIVVKERPILFSGEMVRAILDRRKTQTRRIMKTQPVWVGYPGVPFKTSDADPAGIINCPYGHVGQRLWVRETWSKAKSPFSRDIFYKADGDRQPGKQLALRYAERETRWRPSIHMPRDASRITLEITGIRVERLQEISEADAIAEGIESVSGGWKCYDLGGTYADPVHSFDSLWSSINGPDSWAVNPWVWVIEFRRIEQQTDWVEAAP